MSIILTLSLNYRQKETIAHLSNVPSATTSGLDAVAGSQRLYYLDWLRVISFTLLIVFHAALPFVDWRFYIHNDVTSDGIKYVLKFFNPWRLPLLFLISGIGVWFALGRRSYGVFLKDRFQRLIVPLAFGILVIVPPQFYFNQLHLGTMHDSYVSFFGTYWAHLRVEWNHLWFLLYLAIYILMALPLFLNARRIPGRIVGKRLAAFFENHPARLALLAIPLVVVEWWTGGHVPGKRQLINDGYHFVFYFLIFLYGFFIAATGTLWSTLEKYRHAFLVTGAVGWGIVLGTDIESGRFSLVEAHAPELWLKFVWNANVLAWIFGCVGYAKKNLNFSNRLLTYSNQAILPLYVLHQTVIVGLAYYLVPFEFSVPVEFGLLAVGTLVVSWAIYELAVRPFAPMRVLFGMKGR